MPPTGTSMASRPPARYFFSSVEDPPRPAMPKRTPDKNLPPTTMRISHGHEPSESMEKAASGIAKALRSLAAGTASQPRVWVDIGTSYKTLTKWDVLQNSSLVVVGVDPVKVNINHAYQPATDRFVRVHGACAEGAPGHATFNMHKSPTCGTLLPTRADGPKLGTGNDACTGDVPVPTRVPTFPLRMLLNTTHELLNSRIELLKIDVQGAELNCLRSAEHELMHVDNVLLEVQDADDASGLLMYAGSPSIAQLDAFLGRHHLYRQYCEWNRWGDKAREVNCLYSSTHALASRLWATGNYQRGGSIVSYDPLPTRFVRPPHFVKKLRTSSDAGMRMGRPPWSLKAPWVQPITDDFFFGDGLIYRSAPPSATARAARAGGG